MPSSKILVIDDEEIVRQLLRRTLGDNGYCVETVEDGSAALEAIKAGVFNLLITDLKMPKVDGLSVLKKIKEANPYIEVIIITGYPTIESAVEAIKIGAFDFICKPFDIEEMRSTVKKCLEKQEFTVNRIALNELMAFFEISKTTAGHIDLDVLLGRILDFALGIVKAKTGALVLRDEKSGGFRLKVARGLGDTAQGSAAVHIDEGIYRQVTEKREPCIVVLQEDSQSPGGLNPEPGGRPVLYIPLVSRYLGLQGEALGMIQISEKISGEHFTEREQVLLSTVAGQAVAAIENYQLFNQLQVKVEALEHTIKELAETQNQLIQSEKMAAVGQLAFGIAHEIRNPLGIILGGVEFIKSNVENENLDEITEDAIQKIKDSIVRANNIIIDLLKFSRASKLELRTVNICGLVEDVLTLTMNQAYLHNVEIQRKYPADTFIDADATMLRQALFNLCINAIEAMPKGGALTVGVYPGEGAQGQPEGVIVEIADTGGGIPRGILPKIFDPFFTTKEPGKGTGLGLSIVHLILERHKGSIEVESEINKGTKFVIRLPVKGSQP